MKARLLMEGRYRTGVARPGATAMPWWDRAEVPVFVIEQEDHQTHGVAVVVFREAVNVGTEGNPEIIPAGAVREITAWSRYTGGSEGLETFLTVDPATRVA